jgi:hypothetical protein
MFGLRILILLAACPALLAGCTGKDAPQQLAPTASANLSTEAGVSPTDVSTAGIASKKDEDSLPQQTNERRNEPVVPRQVSLDDVRSIVESGEMEVEVLGAKPSAEIQRISTAVRQAMAKNSDWLMSRLQELAPGQELPYHPNLGVTDKEYEQYMGFLKNLQLVPVAKARIRFVAQSDNKLSIETVDGLPEFGTLILDLSSDTVSTPWGNLTASTPIRASERQTATGPFDARSWKLNYGTVPSGNFSDIRLDIGRSANSSVCIICLKAKSVNEGVIRSNFDFVIRFIR